MPHFPSSDYRHLVAGKSRLRLTEKSVVDQISPSTFTLPKTVRVDSTKVALDDLQKLEYTAYIEETESDHMAEENENTFVVSVQWEPDDNFDFPLASQAWLNFDSEHFYIRFYQIVPPLVRDTNTLPKAINAKLVSGVTIPASRMESFIHAMQDAHEKYLNATNRKIHETETEDDRESI